MRLVIFEAVHHLPMGLVKLPKKRFAFSSLHIGDILNSFMRADRRQALAGEL